MERINDMHGLCCYLQIKINHCFRCLYTSKHFRSAEAVKAHMAATGNRRFNSETFEAEFGRFYERLEESKVAEKQRLAIVQHGAWGEAGEEGVTATGKKLVPRDLAWVVKQTPKPTEAHAGVLIARAEAEERAVKGYISPAMFRRTIKSEMKKSDIHRQAKHFMQSGVKNNKLNPIPFECMMFGR